MKIWVDADSCPVVIKEILFKAAKRTGISLTLMANHPLHIPLAAMIHFMQVPSGFDVADHAIVKRVCTGDLVISSDIPLAADVIAKGAVVLSPHGELYTTEEIQARLSMRNFMETLRESGLKTGGKAPFSQQDSRRFANQLDKILSKSRLKRLD